MYKESNSGNSMLTSFGMFTPNVYAIHDARGELATETNM